MGDGITQSSVGDYLSQFFTSLSVYNTVWERERECVCVCVHVREREMKEGIDVVEDEDL